MDVISEDLFREMVGTYVKVEQILARFEALADKKTLKSILESKKQVIKGEFVDCSISDLRKVLK